MTNLRNLIVLEPGSHASIIETYIGLQDSSRYCTNVVSEIVLKAQAHLEHYKLQHETLAFTYTMR
jgi:Fe-S cluster assembly protein SufD